jgi:signal peptidase I
MKSRTRSAFKEYFEALLVAIILALFIRTFVVQAFKIPSGSMLETLQIGDHLLVNKFIYGVKLPFVDMVVIPVSQPQHGDIIVFEYPVDPAKDFIKRVVGLPGDKIEVRDKQLYRNGEPVEEDYIQHTDGKIVPRRDNYGPVMVPEGEYFVMGDNRDESYDSRFWGTVKREKIYGKAWVIYWSWESLTDIRWGRLGDAVHQ